MSMKNKGPLNDPSIGNYKVQQENYEQWVEHYRTAPSISPPEVPTSGGHGFIDYKIVGHSAATDALKERRSEWERAIGPDKERLGLLYKAEQLHNTNPGSRSQMREAMGNLLTYDLDHQHPIANRNRDLHSEPYTPQEQSNWHRRDGRDLTTRENDFAEGWDWRNHLAYQSQPKPFPRDGEAYFHPKAEPVRAQEAAQEQRELLEVQQISRTAQAPNIDGDTLREQRQRTMQP